eukprot:15281550-Alexandrium_andersonii.AAC.1
MRRRAVLRKVQTAAARMSRRWPTATAQRSGEAEEGAKRCNLELGGTATRSSGEVQLATGVLEQCHWTR